MVRQQGALLNSIPDIAWLKDKESRFIAVNVPFGQACGVSPEELVGKTDFDIWPKELAERYRSLVDSSPEMIFIVCDGRIVYMNDTGLKLLGASHAAEVVGKPIIVEVLSMQGYTVLRAANGDEALRLCSSSKETIQLLLTDLIMPGMSGKDLAERMTRAFPGIKVLFMSGYVAGDASTDAILTTGENFLSKPFTLSTLTKKVKAVLDSPPENRR